MKESPFDSAKFCSLLRTSDRERLMISLLEPPIGLVLDDSLKMSSRDRESLSLSLVANEPRRSPHERVQKEVKE